MQLSDNEIAYLIETGHIGVDPFDAELIQPASLDVRFGDRFRFIESDRAVFGGQLRLEAGRFALAHTLESFKIPDDLAVRVEGKSSWGRRGLMVHLTAGFIDPGFQGQITLELFNASSQTIKLDQYVPIAQLSFHKLSSPARRPYGSPGLGSRYQGQTGPTPAVN